MYEQDNCGLDASLMHALAFLYDHLRDFPSWIQRLTPSQIEQLASVLSRWKPTNEQYAAVQRIEDVERREFTRALALCKGDVYEAARALGIGRTTLYRRLKEWGYSPANWRLISQAAVLACVHPPGLFAPPLRKERGVSDTLSPE